MHVEFAHLLQGVLKTKPFSEGGFTKPEAEVLNQIACSASLPQVTDTPAMFDELLTSSLSFAIAKQARSRQLAEERVTPLIVCSVLIASLEEAEQPWFELAVGGPGHLNASPTERFRKDFFQHVVANAGSCFSTLDPFFVAGGTEETARVETISSNWDAIEKNMKDGAGEEVARIRKRGQLDADDAMMIVALCGDPSIDAGAYLKGLHGCGNVPWYLRRTVSTASDFAASLVQTLEWNQREKVLDGISFDELSQPLKDAERLVLSFRDSLSQAVVRRRADRFAMNLLEVARAFYGIYNRPNYRALDLKGLSESDARFVPVLVVSLSQILTLGLNLLENCCGNAPFVLHTN